MRFRLHATQSASSGQVSSGQVTKATTQVTGDDDVHTVGALDINSAEPTAVTFADTFNNGISHAQGSSIFNAMAAGDYSINACLRVTAGTVTHRGLYWVILRRYTQRTTTEATGTVFRDYQLGNCYYRATLLYSMEICAYNSSRLMNSSNPSSSERTSSTRTAVLT